MFLKYCCLLQGWPLFSSLRGVHTNSPPGTGVCDFQAPGWRYTASLLWQWSHLGKDSIASKGIRVKARIWALSLMRHIDNFEQVI